MTTETRTPRVARVQGDRSLKEIQAYMPGNYQAVEVAVPGGSETLIVGHDVAGWTLEDYVIPRLASGLIFAEVV